MTAFSFRPRYEVETDPSFKQLIPYCIFRHHGQVFHYKRGKLQGEGRLHSKRSIGVGGHISAEDRNGESSVYQAYSRELIHCKDSWDSTLGTPLSSE